VVAVTDAALTVTVDDHLRESLTRALIAEHHQGIRSDVDSFFNGEKGCGGPAAGSNACGGCGECVYAQSTWQDLTGDGLARWRLRATHVLNHLRTELTKQGAPA
jgi:hypothetical protein